MQELLRGLHVNVFTTSLDLKVLVAGGGEENIVLSINYLQLNALSTFLILYHLVKAFMTYTRERGTFFQLQNWLFQIFFPNYLSEWSQHAPEMQNSESIAVFKNKIPFFIRPSKRSIFNVNDPEDAKYLARLRRCFSHLNEHKIRHGFLDTLNPLCNCSLEVEDNEYFFPALPQFWKCSCLTKNDMV